MIAELRLVELTSALTLAVLAASHNVIIVLFFLLFDGEGGDVSFTQGVGYAVNTVGFVLYAGVRYWQQKEEALNSRRLQIQRESRSQFGAAANQGSDQYPLQHDGHDSTHSGRLGSPLIEPSDQTIDSAHYT